MQETETSKKGNRFRNIIIDVIIFFAVFAIIMTISGFFKFPRVSGDSMSPGLSDNQRVVALKTQDVSVGDVVVIWSDTLDEYIIKRVIGVGGDHIDIKNGHLYRNGVMVYEPYVRKTEPDRTETISVDVPQGEVFVLGDNRNHSTDSRSLGTISLDCVEMKVLFKLF